MDLISVLDNTQKEHDTSHISHDWFFNTQKEHDTSHISHDWFSILKRNMTLVILATTGFQYSKGTRH